MEFPDSSDSCYLFKSDKEPEKEAFYSDKHLCALLYFYGSIGRNALYLPFPNERNIQYSTRSIGDEGCGFYFRSIYIISGIWQGAGWGTILYIASLAGVDQELYEAAEIDGANIWQKIRYIDLPSLIPVAMMVFILDCGKLLSSNTDKALVMQTAGNIPTSDIIGVYVYNVGLGSGQFSYTAAIGLFVNIINFVMIIAVNRISKKVTDVGLF